MHSNRQSQPPDHAVLGQKANGCVATHAQPQRTWSKALSEEGCLEKKKQEIIQKLFVGFAVGLIRGSDLIKHPKVGCKAENL